MKQLSEGLVQRLWSKTDRSGGPDSCWEWQGQRDRDGYGRMRAAELDIKNMPTHRVAYMSVHGEIQKGFVLAHSCDNKPCCNPKHLSAVTHQENMRQAKERNLIKSTGKRLSKEQRKQMVADYKSMTFYELQSKYRVSFSTVRNVIWESVDPAFGRKRKK